MAETLYTKKQFAQWRGPTTSDKYNERLENLYRDLVSLYNRVGLTEELARMALQRIVKDHFYLMQALLDLESRVETLEAAQNKLSFRTDAQLDTGRFDSTLYEVIESDTLFHDGSHGVVTLPKVVSSSASKIYFVNSNSEAVLPSTFEALTKGDETTLDNQTAFVDTSDLYGAFLPDAELVWERNIISDTADSSGAMVNVYVRLPIDLLANANVNNIMIHPFPIMGTEIVDVSYSTQTNITLTEQDNYTPINDDAIYFSEPLAVGWLPPGGWSGDTITAAGPKSFYFDPKPITAVRIKLRQKNYMVENGKYVYSYGMSLFDVRYDKFLDEGRAIFRFDAPDGETISDVTNVLPQIWNVSEAELPSIFDYRVIWETSYNSGVYSLNAVPFSKRVWIEVTLRKTLGKGSPALSGLSVSYT